MTKIERTCPRCGLVFASEKLDGLCPSCLLDSLFSESDLDDSKAFWEEDGGDDNAASASSSPSTESSRRFSHFELLEELGRGGMGIVYRARDVGTGRIVALKVLQAHHLEVPDLVTRFRSEVRAVTSLDHPHVLPVHEVGEYEGIPFFSMKLTTGGSLAQRVGDYLGKPTEIARLLAKVARGVAHAHERGILHRDLKPGNILLDAAGEPYVCDFGLAKWIEDDRNLTITSAVLGTPHYIAPEQASGKKGLTTAADIYSLGAIIYELLTARPPFVGQSIIETLRLASENTPERPSSLAQNIPKDLETICLKCLEREPASRYPSAAALATDLENWIEGRPILARPVGAAEQLWRWARRNPLPAALIASIAMLLAATAVVATVSAVRIEKARDFAVAEQKKATERLHESLIAQARASLLTGQAGQSIDAIDALRDAAKIRTTSEVRNLAIRALALSDIEVAKQWWKIGPNSRPSRAFDSKLEHIAEEVNRGTIRILRLADSREVAAFKDPNSTLTAVDRILYSPGDHCIAARYSDGTLKVWNIATKQKRYELKGAPIPKAPWYAPSFAFNANGTALAIASINGGVAIHDASTGSVLSSIETDEIIRCVAFSPDGLFLALAGYDKASLSLWDVATRRRIHSFELPAPAYSVAWSPDGREIAAGAFDYNLYLFHASSGRRIGIFNGHRQEVTQVIFSPRGDRLISTSLDKTIRLWSLSALTEEVVLNSYGSEPALRFSSDGSRLAVTNASSSAHLLYIRDASDICRTYVNGRAIGRATLVGGLAFSPDGKRVATATYEGIDLWNLEAGRALGTYEIDPDAEKSVRFGADSSSIIVGSRRSGLTEYVIVENRGESSLNLRRKLDTETEFIFSNSPPGDRDLIGLTSSRKGVARIFDLRTSTDVLRLEKLPEVWDLAISPDRTLLTLSFSGMAPVETGMTQIRNLSNPERAIILPGGQAGTARFSPDGQYLKISGRGQTSHLFKAPDWRPDMTSEYEGAYSAFHARGWLAATVGASIRIWRTPREQPVELESPLIPSTGFRLAFSPTQEVLAAHSAHNLLLVWNLKLLGEKLNEAGIQWSSTVPSPH